VATLERLIESYEYARRRPYPRQILPAHVGYARIVIDLSTGTFPTPKVGRFHKISRRAGARRGPESALLNPPRSACRASPASRTASDGTNRGWAQLKLRYINRGAVKWGPNKLQTRSQNKLHNQDELAGSCGARKAHR
jgi:hypothetical protein